MSFDLIIRGGNVVRETGVARADIAVADEKIVAIEPQISGDARETIDATGLHVFPGVIDPHVHFNDPGRADWEGIDTGSAAFAAGGGTLFFDMPLNSSPPVLDGESFDLKLAAMKEKSLTDFGLWGGLTPVNLDHLEELAQRGVIGFKAFMSNSGIVDFPAADDFTLYRGMEIAADLGLIVAVHAENDSITTALADEAIERGETGPLDYVHSRPVIAEVEAIQRAIHFAAYTGCKLHIVHVSSEDGCHAAQIGQQIDVTYETCPHYFLLTEDDLAEVGARGKCAPPLRPASDAKHLRDVMAGGEVSFVASDHSPAPPSMKTGDDFFRIWGGIAGVQSTLAAVLSAEPALPPQRVAALTAKNAAARFRIARKGAIVKGYDADFALVDLAQKYLLTRDMLLDRHKLSPYVGRTFRGVVKRTISRGRTIFLDGKIVAKPAGRLIKPA
jgi:allantoinase